MRLLRSTEEIDAALLAVIGLTHDEFLTAQSKNHELPGKLFRTLLTLIEDAEVEDLLAGWREEDQPSMAGRKGLLPPRAIFMALLLNCFWGEGYSYHALGETIAHRITHKQAMKLGYNQAQGDRVDWYHRAWRSLHRILHRIDGWHQNSLHKKKTGAEHEHARTLFDPARAKRCDTLGDRLVQASVQVLPTRYLTNYRGDSALDSTHIPVSGTINPNDYSKRALKARKGLPKRDMRNVDNEMGWYTRQDNHDGSEKSHSLPGYELDTCIMIDAKNGKFPFSLITAIRFHQPGKIKDGPREAVQQHAAQFPGRSTLAVDRAFNGLNPADFQGPIRRLGIETAYDYKVTDLGPQGHVPGHPVIIVDGVPYVNRMPEKFVMITRWYAQGIIDPNTGEPYTAQVRNEILIAREAYRMKAKDLPDKDGHQRFTYPNPRGYIAFDPVTGKPTKDQPTGTVTLGLDHEVIKHLQKHPWMSPKWNAAYHQRSQVETSNKRLKEASGEHIDDPKLRTGRGHTYTYLMCIIATVIGNLRRIAKGITTVHTAPPTIRARRRRDTNGTRLPHHTQTIAATTANGRDPVMEVTRE